MSTQLCDRRPRVAILTEAGIRARLGGTGIRYLEIARHLVPDVEVHLGSLFEIEIEIEGVQTFSWGGSEDGALRRRLSDVDVIVVHGFVLDKLPWIRDLRARLVIDLSCPFVFENYEVFCDRGESVEERQAFHARDREVLLRQLEAGDFFLCACTRQRDWLLGLLSATGQLSLEVLDAQRGRPDGVVGIVPTGLSPQPRATEGPLKGRWPGINREDFVMIWGGGLWSWLDAETVLRAMERVCRRRDDVKLFFLSRRTAEEVIEMPANRRAFDLVLELGLSQYVIFNDRYVDYGERTAYFQNADIGVSAHFDSFESHFSFRVRMLDYLNAGLPILTSQGDFFGDLVEREDIGRALPTRDVIAWAEAIDQLATDHRLRDRLAQRSLALREQFRWEACVEPLRRYCLAPPSEVSPRGRLRPWGTSAEQLAMRSQYDAAVAYARKLERDLAEVQAVERQGSEWARRLQQELDRLQRGIE